MIIQAQAQAQTFSCSKLQSVLRRTPDDKLGYGLPSAQAEVQAIVPPVEEVMNFNAFDPPSNEVCVSLFVRFPLLLTNT